MLETTVAITSIFGLIIIKLSIAINIVCTL